MYIMNSGQGGKLDVYLKNAVSRLKSPLSEYNEVLSDYRQQANSMKSGGYVDKRISFYSILCAVVSLLFACFMCYLWMDAIKEKDKYQQFYEYYKQQMDNQNDK